MTPAVAFTLAVALAQGAASPAQPSSPPDGSTVTVTGCLAKGETSGSFLLTGVRWDSTNTPTAKPGAHHAEASATAAGASDAPQQVAAPQARESLRLAGAAARLKLDAHLGHTITATGMLARRDPIVTPGVVLPDVPPATSKPGGSATSPTAEPPPAVLNLRSFSHVAGECK